MGGSFRGLYVDDVRTVSGAPEEIGQLLRIIAQKFGSLLVLRLNFHFNAIAGKSHSDRHKAELSRLQLKIENPENASGRSRGGGPVQIGVLEG